MDLNVDLLESSFDLITPRADELVKRFYERLFREHPEVRAMFPDDMGEQQRHLAQALATIVNYLRSPDQLREYLGELGLRHVAYRVKREHYPIVGRVLVASMAELAGDAWTEEHQRAWTDGYAAVQGVIFGVLDEYGDAAD